ncbi:hypothetical protein HD806DRAFT_509472 [Xylariaceae sp. AK1471]|nr:hypothetical protein HD806DRAFT_509472 [Xylariaceae sp. AK1471]
MYAHRTLYMCSRQGYIGLASWNVLAVCSTKCWADVPLLRRGQGGYEGARGYVYCIMKGETKVCGSTIKDGMGRDWDYCIEPSYCRTCRR